jgi:DNA polymerase I-like protein with 3'-5' exonuclease and polymerase domains/flagellar biosynthesis chaperone FliJ
VLKTTLFLGLCYHHLRDCNELNDDKQLFSFFIDKYESNFSSEDIDKSKEFFNLFSLEKHNKVDYKIFDERLLPNLEDVSFFCETFQLLYLVHNMPTEEDILEYKEWRNKVSLFDTKVFEIEEDKELISLYKQSINNMLERVLFIDNSQNVHIFLEDIEKEIKKQKKQLEEEEFIQKYENHIRYCEVRKENLANVLKKKTTIPPCPQRGKKKKEWELKYSYLNSLNPTKEIEDLEGFLTKNLNKYRELTLTQKNDNLYLDVESSGLKGPLNLIQYKYKDGPIVMFRPYKEPEEAKKLLMLLNDKKTRLVGYNIVFDIYKLYQFYTPSEPFKCSCIDLYLHVLRGKPLNRYPSRGKSVIQIKNIPSNCVEKMEEKITKKLYEFIPNFFTIKVKHSEDKKDKTLVSLSFKISFDLKLKSLIAKLFKEETLEYKDCFFLMKDENKKVSFITEDERLKYDALYAQNEAILDDPNSKAWEYSKKDIEYLLMLEKWLIEQGNEVSSDENDFCTHIVAYTKFHGFTVNVNKIVEKKQEIEKEMLKAKKVCDDFGVNPLSPKQKKEAYEKYMSEESLIPSSLNKKNIQIALKEGFLNEEGIKLFENLLNYQSYNQRLNQIEIFELSAKKTGKVFPDFRVFGTATNRMAGTGGLNFQGISSEQGIRELVYASQGGDFDSLEIGIAASYFQDKQMLADLDNGVDLHTQSACLLGLTDFTYENAMKIKDLRLDTFSPEKQQILKKMKTDFKKARSKAKQINFAILYFATAHKIGDVLGLDSENAEKLMNETFFTHYPQLLENRQKFQDDIVTADTDSWSKNCIDKMVETVTDAVGNVRNFSVEKQIAKYFWENSQKLADEITEDLKGKVVRRQEKGEQTYKNAVLSAILGAVINIQNTLYRQAGNYPIQATGATYTKRLMQEIWQRHGVPMMNVHDEILIPANFENKVDEINNTVQEFIKKHKKITKHLSMEWKKITNWSEK